MQITLQQLKEIAKAGYGDGVLSSNIFNLESSYIFVENENESFIRYILRSKYLFNIWMHRPDGYLDSDYSYEKVLEIEIADGYVNITTCQLYVSSKFNHLAAIRKMEELGLIEK